MIRYCNILLISIILLMSCKKEEDTFPRNQNSFETFCFINKIVPQKIGSDGAHLMGFQFSVAQRGKINQLGILNGELGIYDITIQDSATKTIIYKDTIRQTSLVNWTFRDAYPNIATVEPGNKYYIYTKNLPFKEINVVKQKDYSVLNYPLKLNNITIQCALFAKSESSPWERDTTLMYGFVDFTFRQDR